MADTNQMPEGTDTIIEGAGAPRSSTTGNTSNTDVSGQGAAIGAASGSDLEGDLIVSDTDRTTPARTSNSSSTSSSSSSSSGGIRESLKSGGDKLKSEVSTRTYGLVGQGLERGSDALQNVSALINDTVAGIEDKLGPQYADYARSAATSLQSAATNLGGKDPEELIDDVRELVRKSPGVALTGAAILGFALVRLVKAGNEAGTSGTRSSSNRAPSVDND
ncbi:hypothetical protein HMF7854_09340 [Sphingomonas ginkgonis]|uniref:Uncharacterized protein n=1 Tax=Sphingomonas ginkgonis TaxID=2315330 RepID=A0A429VAP2_9SPHN|nr:hypothetical protein [Sphingomonas ginkgonis]RST31018.1 hypothetical protein HMF7854_09340 [Sphingomonas ginkgonis]